MTGWEPFDLVIDGPFETCSRLFGEVIKYPNIVKFFAHLRMESDAVERVAQNPTLPGPCIKQGSSSKTVAHSEESLLPSIPNHKRIITDDTVNEAASPKLIGLENDLRIGCRPLAQIVGAEIFRKLLTRVN